MFIEAAKYKGEKFRTLTAKRCDFLGYTALSSDQPCAVEIRIFVCAIELRA